MLVRLFCTVCNTEFTGRYTDGPDGQLEIYNPLADQYVSACPACDSTDFETIDGTPIPQTKPDDAALAELIDLTAEAENDE